MLQIVKNLEKTQRFFQYQNRSFLHLPMETQASFNEKTHQLSIIGESITEISPEIASKYSETTKRLDLTDNKFSSFDSLKPFSKISHLILDNNFITHNSEIPSFPNLKTLYLNNNKVNPFFRLTLDSTTRSAP